MKRIMTSMLLFLALCMTAFPQNASDFMVDANGIITKYIGFDTVVVIPSNIGGKKITAIGSRAFQKANLTSVTIPEGITSIGYYAFSENNLTSITIPNSVTFIGEWAFNSCTSLTRVTFATGSNIPNANFGDGVFPEGNVREGGNTLKTAYSTGKAGTYTRSANGSKWAKN